MVGNWMKAELVLFYELWHAFANLSEEAKWKQIWAGFTNRSPESIAALYNRHKTILSLPNCTLEIFLAAAVDVGDCTITTGNTTNGIPPTTLTTGAMNTPSITLSPPRPEVSKFSTPPREYTSPRTGRRKTSKRTLKRSLVGEEDSAPLEKKASAIFNEDSAAQSLLFLCEGSPSPPKTTKSDQKATEKSTKKARTVKSGFSSFSGEYVTTPAVNSSIANTLPPLVSALNSFTLTPGRDKVVKKYENESESTEKDSVSETEPQSEDTPSPKKFPHLSHSMDGYANRIQNALLQKNFRKWCMHEWFYPEIDAYWYQQNPFKESLLDMGIRQHLFRSSQWKYIRSQMYSHWGMAGPRLFSSTFVKEERHKLHQERNTLRLRRKNSSTADSALPVSTEVIVVHPRTRELVKGRIVKPWKNNSYHVRLISNLEKGVNGEMQKGIEKGEGNVMENMDVDDKEEVQVPDTEAMQPDMAMNYNEKNNYSNGSASIHVEDNGVYSVFTKEDVERVSSLYTHLSQKEKIQSELASLNAEAKEKERIKIPVDNDFYLYYLWLFLRLEKINEKISNHLAELKKRESQISLMFQFSKLPSHSMNESTDKTSLQDKTKSVSLATAGTGSRVNCNESEYRSSNNTNHGHGYDWYAKISKECWTNSANLVEKLSFKTAGQPEESSGSLDEEKAKIYITKCTNLIHHILAATKYNLEDKEVRLLLDAALTSVRPQHETNMKLYKEIQNSALVLQNYLLKEDEESGTRLNPLHNTHPGIQSQNQQHPLPAIPPQTQTIQIHPTETPSQSEPQQPQPQNHTQPQNHPQPQNNITTPLNNPQTPTPTPTTPLPPLPLATTQSLLPHPSTHH
eukprot:TRINITY_DN1443_c0_g4_i1.p1 TRINITY_DN1443_c0_g4~~TRINITY_DN1443_c0_g4_i1.p1  ORF type:complete len:876 (+),score=229.26 TRINITY_DN1443_c0_g4_i1:73-2628(+)